MSHCTGDIGQAVLSILVVSLVLGVVVGLGVGRYLWG